MDILPFLLDSPLNKITFGIMTLLLIETVVVVIWNERLRLRVVATNNSLRKSRNQGLHTQQNGQSLTSQINAFLYEVVGRARGLLNTLEEVGPIMGLICTFLAFTVALPAFWDNLENDPDLFFAKIGMAMGTSGIGLTIKLIAFIQGSRVDADATSLVGQIGRTTPTLQPERTV